MTTVFPADRPHVRFKIDEVQKALRMAQRLGVKDVFNWAEILRAADAVLKNAAKDPDAQEQARRMYLETIAGVDESAMPPALRPIVITARNILAVDHASGAVEEGPNK